MGFYSDLADMANDLLKPDAEGGLGQVVVQIKRITVTPPPNNWTPGAEVETVWTIRAAVRRRHQRYEGGALIIETGDQIIAGTKATLVKLNGADVSPVEQDIAPLNSDLVVINGLDRAIDNITPIPGAGVISAWKLWSKA